MRVYGAGTAFFGPAFDAIVPQILAEEELAQANALDQLVRPIAFRLIGPALGGWLVASIGAGSAFALDAASFIVSAIAVQSIARLPVVRTSAGSVVDEIREGFRFVRARVWLWGTLLAAAIAYLAFMGPAEVLLPFLVKNELHAGAGALGLVFAAGGIGAILSALVVGQRGLPRRDITWMYLAWTIATVAVAGYGIAQAVWQLMLACFVFNALETAGTIVWATAKQRHVPTSMLGRVSSLDWLISIGLVPRVPGPHRADRRRDRPSCDARLGRPARSGRHVRGAVPARDARDRVSARRDAHGGPAVGRRSGRPARGGLALRPLGSTGTRYTGTRALRATR